MSDTVQNLNLTSYYARQLIHSPSNTTTFLRGDNTFTNCLTNSLQIQQTDGSYQDLYVIRGQHGIWMGVDTDNKTHGIYSTSINQWLIRVDPDTNSVEFSGNAATASQLSNTTNVKTQFLRADNVWTNTLDGPFNVTSSQILTFEYLGYDSSSEMFTGHNNKRGSLSVDTDGVTLTLPNGNTNNNSKVPLTFFVKNAYDNNYATIENLNLITHAMSEFSASSENTSGLILREVERGEDGDLTDISAPRLSFNWKEVAFGSLFLNAEGKFNLIQSDNSVASLSAIVDEAVQAQSDKDGLNDIRDQYVRVYNSNKLRGTINDIAGFNQELTIDQMATYGNSMGTINSAVNNPTGSASKINCISISQQMSNNSTRYTSQLAINPQLTTIYVRSAGNSNFNNSTTWRQIPTFTANTDMGSTTVPVYVNSSGQINPITSYSGTSAKAVQLETARTIWGQSFNGTANITGQLNITNADILISNSGTATRQIKWIVGDNDYARIAAGASASDTGWMEIATADGGDEPIYVRQYTGEYNLIARTLTLLDGSGNSNFPGSITASTGGFIGNLTGTASNAAQAEKLTTSTGSNEKPVYFANGVPVQCSNTLDVSVSGSAAKLTTNAGSNSQPVYFLNGIPVVCSSTLSVSITGSASSAAKLAVNGVNTSAGDNETPVYFLNGVPTACDNTLNVNIKGNAATANSASSVDWSNIQNKPGASGSFTTIPWSSISDKPNRAACIGTLDGGPASYIALENITNNGGQINFDTGSSAAIRNIYFNALHRYTSTNAASATEQLISTDVVSYYFCSYRGTDTNNMNNAYVYAGRVYNAYWNDYAEFRRTIDATPGHVVVDQDDGSLKITDKRLMPGAQIITDTYGHAMGESEKEKTPIAVAGRVLAYPYKDKKEYHAGMAVCSAPNGTVDIMSKVEIVLHPDCIIGFVSEIPSYEKWGDIMVNNRIWIKLR